MILGGSGSKVQMFKQQADVTISQANPVSTTLYTVLNAKNVQIHSIMAAITWAVTQPNPLDVLVTVDGTTRLFTIAAPISGAAYHIESIDYAANGILQSSGARNEIMVECANKQCSGRDVLVQARVTWAVTQPDPLVCRVKYAKVA